MSQKLEDKLQEAAFSQPICQHCKINPKATQPYMERVNIETDDLTEKLLKSVSEKTGVPKECVACIGFINFMKLSKDEQFRLLENEYEWRKKQGLA